MKLSLGPEIMSSYKRLAYQAWYALAEFVDNATQAYFNNIVALNTAYKKEKTKLTVNIKVGKDKLGPYIRVTDNSIGMSEAEPTNAIHIGKPPKNTTGRSRYGLGLKTGASWFGDVWTIESKKLDDSTRHKITINVPRIAGGHLSLPHRKSPAPANEHGTTIEIRELHRTLSGRTLGKTRDYLRSLYRWDISEGLLDLIVNDELLSWDADIDKRLLRRKDNSLAKEEFKFKIGGKLVTGWAGVLEKGSRKAAGFSVIQAHRVISGWPNSYRPETLFGPQVGGSNDLVNQRLCGEISLDEFEVSHTKDQILFEGDEQEQLEVKLAKELTGLRLLAQSHRKGADERVKQVTEIERDTAVESVEKEIISQPMQDFYTTYEVPNNSLIRQSNEAVKEAVVRRIKPQIKVKLGNSTVSVYLAKDMSPNDPYVIIESTKSRTSVIVIINLSHPHWADITTEESTLNFIRHSTYDGLAEHKAFLRTGKLEPDTVKLIKDNLLRIPMTMKMNP